MPSFRNKKSECKPDKNYRSRVLIVTQWEVKHIMFLPSFLFFCLLWFLFFYMFEYSRSHFAVDVRTSSSRGMVFFMGDQMGNRYVALYLSKGRYVLAVVHDGKKIKIKSKAKYSDGQWHMVRMGCLCFLSKQLLVAY